MGKNGLPKFKGFKEQSDRVPCRSSAYGSWVSRHSRQTHHLTRPRITWRLHPKIVVLYPSGWSRKTSINQGTRVLNVWAQQLNPKKTEKWHDLGNESTNGLGPHFAVQKTISERLMRIDFQIVLGYWVWYMFFFEVSRKYRWFLFSHEILVCGIPIFGQTSTWVIRKQ